MRRVDDGAILSARGAPAEEWCGVARGAVRVSSVSLAGKQVTLTYVEPGTWFGDIALFDGLPRTHDANAHGATTLLVVRKADFKELLALHVELYEALLRLNCRRLRLLFDTVEDLNTLPLSARLAKQILLLARSYGVAAGRRDPDRPAAGAGRPRAAARRLAPARQPGAQGLRARGRGARSSRRGWSCCRKDKLLAIAQRSARCSARGAPNRDERRSQHRHQAGRRAARLRRGRARALPASSGCPASPARSTVEQFKGGQSNPTYKLLTPERAYVHAPQARAGAKLLPSAHAVDREFRVMNGARRHRRAGAAHARAVRGRERDRPRLLRDGVRRRPRALGPGAARRSTAPSAARSTTR